MSLIVLDGATVEIDPRDVRVLMFDWDGNLEPGVSIASQAYRIEAVKARDAVAIASITLAGSLATVTTVAAHGYTTSEWVAVSGATQPEYNTAAQVTVTGATTFTMPITGSPASPATGVAVAVAGLGMDSSTILSASPSNSRATEIRLFGGGAALARKGRKFEVSNTAVTNETPAQTKDRSFFVVIADL